MFKVGDYVYYPAGPIIKPGPGIIIAIQYCTNFKLYKIHFYEESIDLWMGDTQIRHQAKISKKDLL